MSVPVQMRFRKTKVGAAAAAILGFGAGIPAFTVWWHLYRRTDIPASIPVRAHSRRMRILSTARL